MGWTTNLITGLAEYLAANGVGTWRPSGTYASGETAITVRGVPAQPDRLITLSAYPLDAGYPGLADTTVGVQFRLRGTTDPRVCDDLADALFDLLDSATHLTLGGVHVVLVLRRSYTSLGFDANERWERSENYALDAMRPTQHRTD